MSARILIVDDILPNVKLLEAKLSAEYYEVLTAMNGEEALKKVEGESPDMVLLDVMMPGMDGFEVCTKIKENPKKNINRGGRDYASCIFFNNLLLIS